MVVLNRRNVFGALGAVVAAPARVGGNQIAPRLARGINIRTPMLWPEHERENPVAYKWPPFQGPGFALPDKIVPSIRRLGLDFIRFEIDIGIYMVSGPERRAQLDSMLIDRTRIYLSQGLNVVFDLHTNLNNRAYAAGISLTRAGSPEFSQFVGLVRHVAGVLRSLPLDRIAFEIINEPPLWGNEGVKQWQSILEVLHLAARSAAPFLPLVLSGSEISHISGLVNLDTRPFRSSNVFYTFHYYEPNIFTAQGIDDVEFPGRFVKNLDWPPRREQEQVMLSSALLKLERSRMSSAQKRLQAKVLLRDFYQFFHGGIGSESIDKAFAAVSNWASSQNVEPSRIFLGEFGARQSSDDPSSNISRAAWIRTVRKAAERRGFGWCFFDLTGYGNWNLLVNGTANTFEHSIVQALGLNPD